MYRVVFLGGVSAAVAENNIRTAGVVVEECWRRGSVRPNWECGRRVPTSHVIDRVVDDNPTALARVVQKNLKEAVSGVFCGVRLRGAAHLRCSQFLALSRVVMSGLCRVTMTCS